MKGLRVFSAILLASFLTVAVKSQQTIEFLTLNTDPPGQGVRYDMSMSTVPLIAKRSNKICFNGMWAMYTSTAYGAGNPNVTVYPALGYSLQSCSTSVGPIASKINSFRPLAAPTTAMPVGTGMEFWNAPYFLGTSVTAVPTAAADLALVKSFAINSSLMKSYIITNAAGKIACCNYLNGHYLVPNIETWPKPTPLGDIKTFAEAKTPAECDAADYQPLQ